LLLCIPRAILKMANAYSGRKPTFLLVSFPLYALPGRDAASSIRRNCGC
jgi:hypothetical protein